MIIKLAHRSARPAERRKPQPPSADAFAWPESITEHSKECANNQLGGTGASAVRRLMFSDDGLSG